jgi:ABC-type transport system substrate-binding protein
MAVAMPEVSADGATYTATLKDGIKFGDGMI